MKRLLLGLIPIVMLSGCSPPKATNNVMSAPDLSTQYVVRIIEIEIQGDGLADLNAELFRTPNTPPAEEFLASPVEDMISPPSHLLSTGAGESAGASMLQPFLEQSTVDKLLKLPGATIYEYPVFNATSGETAVYNETEPREVLTDCAVVDGKTVKTMETVELGHFAEIVISQVNGSNITCEAKIGNRTLVGTEVRTLENGDQVEMPFYNTMEVNTVLHQAVDTWFMPGGVMNEQTTENGTTTKQSKFILIRFMPCESGTAKTH